MEIEGYSNQTPWSKETFLKILELRSMSFVIIHNSKLVGFCIANKVLDECHLQNISVAHDMRRKGIGDYMIKNIASKNEVSRFIYRIA